jgi:hypothetical protein
VCVCVCGVYRRRMTASGSQNLNTVYVDYPIHCLKKKLVDDDVFWVYIRYMYSFSYIHAVHTPTSSPHTPGHARKQAGRQAELRADY